MDEVGLSAGMATQEMQRYVFRAPGQSGEFQDVGITDEIGDGFLRLLGAGTLDDGRLVFGKPGALEEEGADLALELALGPVALEALVFVESPLERVVDPHQFDEVRPGEMQH